VVLSQVWVPVPFGREQTCCATNLVSTAVLLLSVTVQVARPALGVHPDQLCTAKPCAGVAVRVTAPPIGSCALHEPELLSQLMLVLLMPLAVTVPEAARILEASV